ncbi:methyl-accepting chemotaxis protein [Tepidibacter hydrothermalis]|uniref:Methyl-accepting chemotaxis protein n=1 Tax=Tepidibacter hydrothermalis TaxID=3036126 RepID=A0ABY8EBH0_9FIRM|nr:methyl-accepting chemotaxis protein [Tepidibacter hydrothermalis]WFD10141.1 methyl-accepting chemotaxis protein [Tepidibacter hydrothermalis]
MFRKFNNIRFKILTIPLIIMFMIISTISFININIAKTRLIDQMELDGVNLAKQIFNQIKNNEESIKIINGNIENDIRNLGEFISGNYATINNEYLVNIANTFKVDEINVTNSNGDVIYSNLESSVGAHFGEDHISSTVQYGNDNEFMEKIRKSRETDDYYKYGYVKISNGGMIQVGILANTVENLKRNLSIESLLDKLANEENIESVFLVDKNYTITSSSNKEDIGTIVKSEQLRSAIDNQEIHSSKYHDNDLNRDVYDITVPMHKDDVNIGSLDISISMDNINKAIASNIRMSIIVGIIAFIISSIIFYTISSNILNVIKNLVDSSQKVARGELVDDIDIKANDETGVLCNNFKDMIKSLKSIVDNVKAQASSTDEMSNHLTGISKEMSLGIESIVSAIQNIADGTTSQSYGLENINEILNNFTYKLTCIIDDIKDVDSNSKEISSTISDSTENVEKVISSVENVIIVFQELIEKISIVGQDINEINKITLLINQIADQTNLLALNASIEAARAGEQGRGFAVVADEIRKLAEQTKDSSQNINELIQTISGATESMIETSGTVNTELSNQKIDIDTAMNSFNKTILGINDIIPKIDVINKSATSLNNEKNIILEKIEEASSIAQEISASTEEISASSEQISESVSQVSSTASDLTDMTKNMTDYINEFK